MPQCAQLEAHTGVSYDIGSLAEQQPQIPVIKIDSLLQSLHNAWIPICISFLKNFLITYTIATNTV